MYEHATRNISQRPGQFGANRNFSTAIDAATYCQSAELPRDEKAEMSVGGGCRTGAVASIDGITTVLRDPADEVFPGAGAGVSLPSMLATTLLVVSSDETGCSALLPP